MEPLRTTEEIADYLRLEPITVRRLATRGDLPAYRIGGEFRFIAREIEDYVKGQRVQGQSMAGMVELFTERARRVLELAELEATELDHKYIGTEHLLLGLLREADGVAAIVLTRSGVTYEAARQALVDILEQNKQLPMSQVKAAVTTFIHSARPAANSQDARPLTPRSKKVMEFSLAEARRLEHRFIGTEHLLLGLLREGDGLAAGILEPYHLTLEVARALIGQILQEKAAQASEEPPAQK